MSAAEPMDTNFKQTWRKVSLCEWNSSFYKQSTIHSILKKKIIIFFSLNVKIYSLLMCILIVTFSQGSDVAQGSFVYIYRLSGKMDLKELIGLDIKENLT